MVRNIEKFDTSLAFHHKMQLDYFNVIKAKLIKSTEKHTDPEKRDNILKEAKNMVFQFDKTYAALNYGRCEKFNKEVSFIPNVCQLETQGCFEHRRE